MMRKKLRNNIMALVKQSEHQFKRNPEIDEKLNQFIKDSEKLVAYVKELP